MDFTACQHCLLEPTRKTVVTQTVLSTFCLNLQGGTFPSPLQEALGVLLAEKEGPAQQ